MMLSSMSGGVGFWKRRGGSEDEWHVRIGNVFILRAEFREPREEWAMYDHCIR